MERMEHEFTEASIQAETRRWNRMHPPAYPLEPLYIHIRYTMHTSIFHIYIYIHNIMYVLSIWCVDWNFNMFTFDVYFRLFLREYLNDYFSFSILILITLRKNFIVAIFYKIQADKNIYVYILISHQNPLIFEKYKTKYDFVIHYSLRSTCSFKHAFFYS